MLRLVIGAVQCHLSAYDDGGMLVATLSLLVTERALQLSHYQKRSLVLDLFDVIMEAATSYLTSVECPVRHLLQLDNLNDLLQLLRGYCCLCCCIVYLSG